MAITGKQSPAPEPSVSEPLDVVETPTSPSSSLARSRFEFETDKRNEGTKILMVEWDHPGPGYGNPSETGNQSNDWEVSWEGKGAVLPVWDAGSSETDDNNIHRVYFLLPPGSPIPSLIDITRRGRSGSGNRSAKDGPGPGPGHGPSSSSNSSDAILRTTPMPAIFPAGLTTSQQDAGLRGVLHTLWARRRLAELQAEIAAEMKANGESVGLEMAMQERQWIVDHFGLAPDQPGMPQPTRLHIPQSGAGPASPRSPLGGRLGEKLRGLKLATSPAELAAASQAAKSAEAPRAQHLGLITSVAPSATSATAAAGGGPGSSGGGVASLDAIVGGAATTPAVAVGVGGKVGGEDATEEDLFALPMSPRSPEMKRSPFSIL